MKLPKKATCIGVAVAVTLSTMAWIGGPSAVGASSTVSTEFTCRGIDGDVAGSVGSVNKSSKELLTLLGSLGGSSELALGVGVTANIPSSVTTGSGPFDASFSYHIALPNDLIDKAKNLLKVNSLKVTNASFAIDVSGAATGTVVGTTASLDVSLATTPVTVDQSLAGQITPTGSGLIYYRPGASSLSVVVNGEVAGAAKIGTLTVSCTASGLLGSTAVKPPGAPNINPNPIQTNVAGGSTTVVDLLGNGAITPDQGNPILADSLKLVGSPSAGAASLSGGKLTFVAPAAGGSYDVSFEICGAARVVKGTAGASEVQTFAFGDDKYLPPGYNDVLNAHPLYFTLTYDGQETAPIVTSHADFLGLDVPFNENDPGVVFLHNVAGRFVRPTPAEVQASLEALPNVEPGDIVVGDGPTDINTSLTTPYTFTFANNLAAKDTPQIALGTWKTWLPNELLTQIIAAASAFTSAPAGPVPPTYDVSIAQFTSGAINWDQLVGQLGDRLKYEIFQNIDIPKVLDALTTLFPKSPKVATTANGEAPIPDSSTGPLCSQGVAQFIVASTEVLPATVTRTAPAATPTSNRVQYTG